MRTIVLPAALSALALLAACNTGAANNNADANSSAPANAALSAPASIGPAQATTVAGGQPVDQTFVVGHWAVRPGCSETVSFEADGTVRVSDDPRPGRWALAGDVLTITPPEGAGRPARITQTGDALVAAPEGGERPMTLTRCDAPAAPPSAK